jgi:hypothetical protein
MENFVGSRIVDVELQFDVAARCDTALSTLPSEWSASIKTPAPEIPMRGF